uniref:Uncharacterized protein n=1 Tax=Aegilops tauschii subsp. strangulata TaxID=200361 RepID=A0A453J2F7_AEGTS
PPISDRLGGLGWFAEAAGCEPGLAVDSDTGRVDTRAAAARTHAREKPDENPSARVHRHSDKGQQAGSIAAKPEQSHQTAA